MFNTITVHDLVRKLLNAFMCAVCPLEQSPTCDAQVHTYLLIPSVYLCVCERERLHSLYLMRRPSSAQG